mgnify:CR=1 FL=1
MRQALQGGQAMARHKIAVIAGGIGKEVVSEGIRVLKAAGAMRRSTTRARSCLILGLALPDLELPLSPQ